MTNVTSITKNKTTKNKYMSSAMTMKFKLELEKSRKEIAKSMRTSESQITEHQTLSDENDIASLQENRTIQLRLRERDNSMLKKIDKALRLIDSGDYGYCEHCGVEIGEARLNARPTSTLCITCKETSEIIEGNYSKKRHA